MSILQFGNRPKKFVFVHQTTFHCFCVRLTNNMMCNLAVELAMASTASTVDLEDSTIQTKGMNIEYFWEVNPLTANDAL